MQTLNISKVLMIDRILSLNCVKSTNLVFSLTLLFFLIISSCNSNQIRIEKTDQQTLFSKGSLNKIQNLVLHNVIYPVEAKESCTSGRFLILLEIDRGGRINKIYRNEVEKNIDSPVVFSANLMFNCNKPSKIIENNASDYVTHKQTILENEGIRVSRMIESLNLPEWQNKNIKFAILFNFQLTNI